MDIPRKPRPWYVKYLYPMLAGTAFLAFATYMIVLSLSPRRLRLDSETCRAREISRCSLDKRQNKW